MKEEGEMGNFMGMLKFRDDVSLTAKSMQKQ
jgi:hypothetical protein